MQKGTLKVQLTTGSALPVRNAVIKIKNSAGQVLYETELPFISEGETRAYELEVPDAALSYEENGRLPYGVFNAEIIAPGFVTRYINGIQVFGGREAILPVTLLPESASFPQVIPPEQTNIPPNALRLPPEEEGDESSLPPRNPTPQLHTVPFIPEYITVHLGLPTDLTAKNVTVTFPDYIKNVASSEIYPTWPEESIRANILAQISFTLNRVFTEWYRSRGYDFDITNTTAFDQYFVDGRNIFQNISEIVDDIFNVYIRKPGNEEPFFARYCNGTTSVCDGLSQWGTVSLANDGLSAEGILEYYYGDVELVESNKIQGQIESYPGNPLRVGTSGMPVRIIQEQLNRIAINYPSIPFIAVDGVFDESTENSVRQFQRIFNLTPDGIVGKATWYAISRVYVAVKDLAELTSEGERADYASQEFPGTLTLGARGVEILELQLYLATIALYNNEVRSVGLDGVFGGGTLDSVVSFQRAYGLNGDGVVGEATWNRLVEVYNGIKDNVNVPTVDGGITLKDYPGTPLREGDRSENVTYIQSLLQRLRTDYQNIPQIAVDGIFGSLTKEAVRAFQRNVGLSDDGIVGRDTWNALNNALLNITTEPSPTEEIPTPAPAPVIAQTVTPTPKEIKRLNLNEPFERPLRAGSVGNDVGKMKKALMKKGYLNPTAADGDIFGIATRRAVELLQKDAGLTPTGRVDEETWKEIFR